MPWPLIAALAGKVLGGVIGGGALGGAAGGAGAAAGAGGAGAAGAASGGIGGAMGSAGGGMMGGKGIMGMMGGGGQQQGGGGMMGGIMNIAKMPMNNMNENADQVVGMLEAQDGALISPELLNYMSKTLGQGQATGQPVQTPQVQTPQISDAPASPAVAVPSATEGMNQVQNQPTGGASDMMTQPMPGTPAAPTVDNPNGGAAPELQSAVTTPTNPTGATANKAPQGKITNPMGDILGTMAANNGKYQTDARGVTQVTESSNIMGDAMSKAKKGNILGAGLAIVSGTMNQASQMRRQAREEEQWGSEMERQMKRSSAYNDPNSVYYAAKDGASINPSNPPLWHQNNNLNSMMSSPNGYMKGGKLKLKC